MKDEIFLLGLAEYEKYKHRIPHIKTQWWLRTEGDYSYFSSRASYVGGYGEVEKGGDDVVYAKGVRPAIHLRMNPPIGTRVMFADFPWIVIDNELAITEVPISFKRFDKNSNVYETSEIRQFLLNWREEREKENEN